MAAPASGPFVQALAGAWRRYAELFGDVPHGTAQQLAALVELMPDKQFAAAPVLLEACKDMLKAADELMTEYVSKKRAANWGVINQAMVDASAAIRAAKGAE